MSSTPKAQFSTPKVQFRNAASAKRPTDQEIEGILAQGSVSNTALSIHTAKKRPGFGAPVPYMRVKPSPGVRAFPQMHARAVEVSDPGLDRSDESAIAINPKNPRNIVAGAASFDGAQFTNTAYVSKDGGHTWKTVTALTNTSEGAGLAFDDSGNCYYATMHGGFFPVCIVSQDGGLTWGPPAAFGFGDKTAVVARGKIALVGFDRINTEACAFTLDAGLNWTVHDFTDRGIGTGPLVTYDHKRFYIIYGALDNNLKLYTSADQGATWTGPITIVAGNSPFSAIAGPLSYEGSALTSPGTNVAIDEDGHLHVLYIDSAKQLPMYTSSKDHGATWSKPVNVNPERPKDAHMWPCLACNKDGDLIGGSMAYNAALGKYSILQHIKEEHDDEWTTFEADNGPWSAAGPSPGFRIGFGDYFDCDCLPENGRAVMAWSETANGAQPWQTFVRIGDLDEFDEARVAALENEIAYLTDASDAQELPFLKTKENMAKFEAHLDGLRTKLRTAQRNLEKFRPANSLP